MHDVAILFKKNLYGLCRKELSRIKKKAAGHDLFHVLLQALYWEMRVIPMLKEGNVEQQMRACVREQEQAIEKQINLNELIILSNAMYSYTVKHGNIRRKKLQEEVTGLMNHPLLKAESRSLSLHAKCHFNNCHALYGFISDNIATSYRHCKRITELFEINPARQRDMAESFVGQLSNLCSFEIELKRFGDAERTIEKMRSLEKKIPNLAARVFEYVNDKRMLLCVNTNRFDLADEIARDVTAGMEKYQTGVSKQYIIVLYTNLAMMYLCSGRYRESLRWLNMFFREGVFDIRDDIQTEARLLNLIVHFELQDWLILPHAFRSAYRYLKKKETLHEFEQIILSSMRKLISANTEQKQKKVYVALLGKLVSLSKDQRHKRIFQGFDYISWLESKISGKTFVEVRSEKME